MAWGDITITYNLDKGAETHYGSFPFVKSTNNIHGAPQSGIYYTPAEIASFINTATSENVTKFSTDGEATTLVNGEWVGSLKNIYPWKGYHFNLSGDASHADYNINFIDAMATTSLDRGKYVVQQTDSQGIYAYGNTGFNYLYMGKTCPSPLLDTITKAPCKIILLKGAAHPNYGSPKRRRSRT